MFEDKEYPMCFACGKKNPIGLKMTFKMDEKECVSYFTPKEEHQSYNGMMHGGLISVLLDEIIGHYLLSAWERALSRKAVWLKCMAKL